MWRRKILTNIDYVSFLFLALGLCLGSFANVLIYRMPKGESVVFPWSHCSSCKKTIPFYFNIPVISWLWLRGKCFFCKEKFSSRYLLVESLTGLLFFFLYLKLGLSVTLVGLLVLSFFLVVLTFIDIDHMILPDVITLSLIPLGFLFSLYPYHHDLLEGHNFLNSLIGFLVGGGFLWATAYFYYVFTKKEGLGGGDVKLLGALGAFLGFKAVLFIILTSSVIGMVCGFIFLSLKKKDYKNTEIPFGPYICLATLIFIFFGKTIVNWYILFLLGES